MSSGVLDNAKLPESFDISRMINIRWKVEIPGLGLSSPVIWDNKLFIASAISQADKEGFKPGIYSDISPVKNSCLSFSWLNQLNGSLPMHTMLLYRNHLYNVNWNGTFICVDPRI